MSARTNGDDGSRFGGGTPRREPAQAKLNGFSGFATIISLETIDTHEHKKKTKTRRSPLTDARNIPRPEQKANRRKNTSADNPNQIDRSCGVIWLVMYVSCVYGRSNKRRFTQPKQRTIDSTAKRALRPRECFAHTFHLWPQFGFVGMAGPAAMHRYAEIIHNFARNACKPTPVGSVVVRCVLSFTSV